MVLNAEKTSYAVFTTYKLTREATVKMLFVYFIYLFSLLLMISSIDVVLNRARIVSVLELLRSVDGCVACLQCLGVLLIFIYSREGTGYACSRYGNRGCKSILLSYLFLFFLYFTGRCTDMTEILLQRAVQPTTTNHVATFLVTLQFENDL